MTLDKTFRFRSISKKGPRDGDGDGFVLDGKPGMRPVTPSAADIGGLFSGLDESPREMTDQEIQWERHREAERRAKMSDADRAAEAAEALKAARARRKKKRADRALKLKKRKDETHPAWHGDASKRTESGPIELDEDAEERLYRIWEQQDMGTSGAVEEYPEDATVSDEQYIASRIVGMEWIGGGWGPLRDMARDLISKGRVNEAADSAGPNIEDLTYEQGVARTITAIRDSPKSWVYRGLSVNESVMDMLTTEGYEFDEPLATATGRRMLAKHFSADKFGTSVGDSDGRAGAYPIVLSMNVKNLPIQPTPDPDIFDPHNLFLLGSDERMISGRYRVKGSEWVSNDHPGYYLVDVEQIDD